MTDATHGIVMSNPSALLGANSVRHPAPLDVTMFCPDTRHTRREILEMTE